MICATAPEILRTELGFFLIPFKKQIIKFKKMKLLTAEGFSFALQVTSLILLIGYSASKAKNDLPKINKSKGSEIYPSYFKIKNKIPIFWQKEALIIV